VSDAVTTLLVRDRPPALATSRDQGALAGSVMLPHIRMALTRPAALQAALDTLTSAQYHKGSAAYHQWLSPMQLRAYGPAQADIDKVTAWLTGHRLYVNSVSPSGMSIDFGGTTANVTTAFHTSLQNVSRRGEAHVANVTAPAIPAALAPVVDGVTLANFFPKPAMRRITKSFTVPNPPNPPYYAVAPPDFAQIYNINPLRGNHNFYGQTITGAGVTLAMVEQTQILSSDWTTFRKAFGLSGYFHGSLKQINPNCASPGFIGDEGEAALDVEWSSAVADGFAFEAAWKNLVEEGAAEGKSIFVSSGDSGTSAEEGVIDSLGLFVNGLSDTAYNVSVGGTDFLDTALNENSTYWKSSNSATHESAKSYIPEIPWNNSCASTILAAVLGVSPMALCNVTPVPAYIQNDIGGSGGQSVYFTKPDWQLTSIPGVPKDGVRDQPDVSLFAANGLWSHFYVFCMSDPNEGGTPCNYSNTNDVFGNAAGGTSFASPAFAGITALAQQGYHIFYGGSGGLGNPAPVLYAVAKAQFATPLAFSQCNSTLGNKISPVCVFQYVTAGDNDQPCYAGTTACKTSSASTNGIGILHAVVDGKNEFAYPAQTGYSLATGLGSVNVTNFVYNYIKGL
jgi:pseudomonalisin